MARSGFWIFIVLIVIVAASMVFFANADIAAPATQVEKILPNTPSNAP